MLEKIAKHLTRRPALVLVLAGVMVALSAMGYLLTRVNYDILTYLPKDLESSQGMDLLEDPFQMAGTSMLIVENMPAGYSNQLIEQIKKVPGVSNAVWLSNLVGIQLPVEMLPAEFRDVFFSQSGGTMMIIQYEKAGASEETMAAIAQVRRLCNEKCFLAGFSVIIKDTRDLVDKELPLFLLLAVLLSIAAMELTMEESFLPLVLMVNIGLAVIYNFGTNVLQGEISYITQAIAAVLQLGVTMDYSVFLYHRYEEERDLHEDHRDAMAVAVAAAARSLFSSSLTTVAGFLALCSMRLTLGRDIGIVMAKGVILGVLTVVLVLPAIILVFDRPLNHYRHRQLLPSFDGLNRLILRHRRGFVVLSVLLFLPALYAQGHVKMYYKLDESLPRDLPSIVSNAKLKEEFDMATSHFVLLSDDLSASEMGDLEARIKALPGVTGLISYHSILGQGIPDFFIPESLRQMLKQGGYQMMMVNSSYETASEDMSRQLSEMIPIIKEYDPEGLVTGEGAMTNDLIQVTARDFVTANYLSIIAIFVIILLAFQSLTVPVILVCAIELAIFINQGCSYFLGTEIAFVVPTIISCVQLGATVDYAILMASRFQEELRAGKDRQQAALAAANSSDASIITSALVMFVATLGVSLVTSIDLIGSICLMLARGAVISALVSIFLMPALLCVFEPVFRKTSLHWAPKPPAREGQEVPSPV